MISGDQVTLWFELTQNRTAFCYYRWSSLFISLRPLKKLESFLALVASLCDWLEFPFLVTLGVLMGDFVDSSSLWKNVLSGMLMAFVAESWEATDLCTSISDKCSLSRNMLTAFMADTILSYGIVGTILLALSPVAPVRLMMIGVRSRGNVRLSAFIYLFSQWLSCSMESLTGPFLDSVRFHFLFASYCSIPLEHRTLVSDTTD